MSGIPLATGPTDFALQIVFAAFASAVYALVWFARRKAQGHKEGKPVTFNTTKMAATVVLGAIIGGTLALAGTPVTQENIMTRLAMYGGYVALIEGVIKAIRDEVQASKRAA